MKVWYMKSLRSLRSTYSLSFLVGRGEFLSLVLKTAQLDLELVKTAVHLREGSAGVVQVIWRE